MISLSVNEAQDRGFVYTKRRQTDGYNIAEAGTLWLHSVIYSDGPNTIVYLTHVDEINSVTSESGDSDWEIVSAVSEIPKPLDVPAATAVTAAKETWHVKVNLSAVGISCVDRRPREVRARWGSWVVGLSGGSVLEALTPSQHYAGVLSQSKQYSVRVGAG